MHKLFAEVAPRYAERPGGYTRILKLGRAPATRPRWSSSSSSDVASRSPCGARDEDEAHDRVRRHGLRRLGAPARRAHRAGGARARPAEGPRANGQRRRAAAADGRRAHRPRRARLGPGRQLRPRGGRPGTAERPARRRRRGARLRAGGRRPSTPAATRPRAPTATACSRGAPAACSSAVAPIGGPARSTAARWTPAPPRSSAGTTSRPSPRARPSTAGSVQRLPGRVARRKARCSSSGSRPTCSCAT